MKITLILIALLFSAVTCSAQMTSKTGYKIRTEKGNFVVTYKGQAHKIKTVDYVDAARVTGTRILLVSKISGFTYLLIDVTGWSKAKQDDRQCGAGTESNLVRVKLDPKWKVTEMDGVRYESCWASTEPGDGYSINKGVLSIEFDNLHDDENVKLKYDANNPEGAFDIVRKKIE